MAAKLPAPWAGPGVVWASLRCPCTHVLDTLALKYQYRDYIRPGVGVGFIGFRVQRGPSG